jgi:alpha-glucosidase
MPWWESAVIYQVYPRSFQDTDDNGVGDLNGITGRLSYLVTLGVDAVWISPIFRSPMADFGYDISDYVDIDPVFGNMRDFDRLIAEAHERRIRVVLDFVPNHSSDQHPWFVESRGSRSSPKRDWYIWRDPAPGGGPPNNWLSEFGGSAWEFDEASGQYYYHAFLRSQPDLNWRNPEVAEAMCEVLRFWMRKGVDGFRVDVIWHLIKDAGFRDNPPNPSYREGRAPHEALVPLNTTDLPEVHDIIAMLRRTIEEFPDRLLIGEIYLPVERLVAYYGRDLGGVHLPFNFALLNIRWEAKCIQSLVDEYEGALPKGGWPNWVLGNHDRPRIASRVGKRQAGVAAMLLLTLRGTPTIYYGDGWRCLRSRSPRTAFAIHSSATFPESVSAGMAAELRCNGTQARTRASATSSPGFRWQTAGKLTTSRVCGTSLSRSGISIAVCCRFAGKRPRFRLAPIGPSASIRICWFTFGSTRMSGCSLR